MSNKIVEDWLEGLSTDLDAGCIDSALERFDTRCFWRDLLALTWNIKTFEGRKDIASMLRATLACAKPQNWLIDGNAWQSGDYIEALISFKTLQGSGGGHVRLINGKCRSILTTLELLHGHEEKAGTLRIKGTQHLARKNRPNWKELKEECEARIGRKDQPFCLIIGGGQGGIALAARLRRLGVTNLVIEKNARAGDSWRNRYRSLVLHDPVWYDHLPYLPFPDDWPVFTPKDKMGDWLEAYVSIMELNYWTDSTCTSAQWDEKAQRWQVEIGRDGENITMTPRHLVLATGAYGAPKMAPIDEIVPFIGDIIHTSQYGDGSEYAGRKVAVIGSASSAHDVCLDLWENDVDVTMIQRSSSIIVKSETLMKLGFESLYSEAALANGITTEKADMINAGLPYAMLVETQRPLYDEIARLDAPFYEALSKSGFLWDFGPDNSGLMAKAMRTASGYYIDVGASQLIIDGEVGLKAGIDIEGYVANGLKMADGDVVEADLIIHATGYTSLDDTVAELISPNLARQIGRFWGYGSGVPGDPGPWEGELRNMWKPTAHRALWFHGGNLALSRQFSKYLALQIKARMEGVETLVYS